MTVAIVGSREGVDWDRVSKYVLALPVGTVLVSGGARGVDTVAVQAARVHGLEIIEYLPDYAKYGRRAPLVRNLAIAAHCDRMVVFWNGKSTGSMHAANCARQLGKPVEIIEAPQEGGR